MRLPALILLVLPMLLFSAGAAAQATLNKCIDANGRVTYSNLPCRGAHEVQKVEIDPPPPRVAPAPVPVPAHATGSAPGPVPDPVPAHAVAPAPVPASTSRLASPQAATAPPKTAAPPRTEIQRFGKAAPVVTPRTCDALSEQLGRVLDQMDAAQRTGVTQQQIDAWTKEIQDLERKKREASCF